MNKFLFFPLVLAAAAVTCPAQVPFPLPPGAPEKAEWLVTFGQPGGEAQDDGANQTATVPAEEAGEGKPVSRRLLSRHVTKDGQTKKIIETFANGDRTESWLHNRLFLFQVPGNKDIYLRDTSSGSTEWLPPMAGGQDFPELSWVTAAQLKGEKEIEGRVCLVFESATMAAPDGKKRGPLVLGGGPAEAEAEAAETVVRKAWIDKATGLPIRASEGPAVYKFAQSPKSPGEMPEAYKALEVGLIQRKKDRQIHKMRLE